MGAQLDEEERTCASADNHADDARSAVPTVLIASTVGVRRPFGLYAHGHKPPAEARARLYMIQYCTSPGTGAREAAWRQENQGWTGPVWSLTMPDGPLDRSATIAPIVQNHVASTTNAPLVEDFG